MSEEQKKDIGWVPSDGKKWHYCGSSGRSLCGKWLTFVTAGEFGNDDSSDNCAACKRKLKARKR